MIGGNAGPYVLDAEAGALLGRAASAHARKTGASLLVSSSARTPAPAMAALEAAIDVPAEIYRWRRDAAENPYLGYLALAQSIIVTCESMSMLAEACATRKPVYMFDLDTGPDTRWPLLADLLGEAQQRSWGRRLRRLEVPAAGLSDRDGDRPAPADPGRADHPAGADRAGARGLAGRAISGRAAAAAAGRRRARRTGGQGAFRRAAGSSRQTPRCRQSRRVAPRPQAASGRGGTRSITSSASWRTWFWRISSRSMASLTVPFSTHSRSRPKNSAS